MSCNAPARIAPLTPALQALVEEHRGLALALAERSARSAYLRHHREDVCSAALLGLVEGAHRWEPSRGSFVSCVYWSILNRIHRFARRGARVVPLPAPAAWEPPREASFDAATNPKAQAGPDDSYRREWTRHDSTGEAEPTGMSRDEERDARRLAAEVVDALVLYRQAARHTRTTAVKATQDRRDAVLFVRHVFNGELLEVLGEEFGLTRQAVHQIVHRMRPAFDAWAAEVRGEAEAA